jgi:hypothetical protein
MNLFPLAQKPTIRALTRRVLSCCAFLLIASFALAAPDALQLAAPPDKISAYGKTVQPKNLAELLALDSDQLEKVDIARINLLCAEGLRGAENLDVAECLSTIDTLARYIERETKRNFHRFLERPADYRQSLPYYQMELLGSVLAQDAGIRYNPELEHLSSGAAGQSPPSDKEWSVFFSSSTDVFLHGLLTGRRSGTCASLPFLQVAISRRLGYPVNLAARKHHLYARYETGDGEHLNIEATENTGFSTPTD